MNNVIIFSLTIITTEDVNAVEIKGDERMLKITKKKPQSKNNVLVLRR